jgi:hypothetical protein
MVVYSPQDTLTIAKLMVVLDLVKKSGLVFHELYMDVGEAIDSTDHQGRFGLGSWIASIYAL